MQNKRVLPVNISDERFAPVTIPPGLFQALVREGKVVSVESSCRSLYEFTQTVLTRTVYEALFPAAQEDDAEYSGSPIVRVGPVLLRELSTYRKDPEVNDKEEEHCFSKLSQIEKHLLKIPPELLRVPRGSKSKRGRRKDLILKMSLDFYTIGERVFEIRLLSYYIQYSIHRHWNAFAPHEKFLAVTFPEEILAAVDKACRAELLKGNELVGRRHSCCDVQAFFDKHLCIPGKTKLFSFFADQSVERVLINRSHPFYDYCRKICRIARIIGNCAIWLMKKADEDHRYKKVGDLDRAVRKECKCYAEISAAFGQKVVLQIWTQFQSWWASQKAFKANPDKFLGPPRMPGYKRKYRTAVISRNGFKIEDHRVIFSGYDGKVTDLPQFMCGFDQPFGVSSDDAEVGDFRIVPAGNSFYAELTSRRRDFFIWGFHLDVGCHANQQFNVIRKRVFSDALPDIKDPARVPKARCSVDLGDVNFLTVAPTLPTAPVIIVKGGVLKSINRKANRSIALLSAAADRAKNAYEEAKAQGLDVRRPNNKKKHIQNVIDARNRAVKDYLHKTSNMLVGYCLYFGFDDIIIGINRGNKQNACMGRKNNQNHCQMPHSEFIDQLTYKAARWRITVTETEESYTSKASALDLDFLPVFKKGEKRKYTFSGSRTMRGLYTRNGANVQGPIKLNCDLNGSLNIARKVIDGQEWLKTLASVSNRGLLERPVVQSPLNTPIWITDPGVVQRLKSQGSSQTP